MKKIKHITGRYYNDKRQELEILVESYKEDEDGFLMGTVTATFVDASRNIKGRVIGETVFGDDIGTTVFAAYDLGRYQTI